MKLMRLIPLFLILSFFIGCGQEHIKDRLHKDEVSQGKKVNAETVNQLYFIKTNHDEAITKDIIVLDLTTKQTRTIYKGGRNETDHIFTQDRKHIFFTKEIKDDALIFQIDLESNGTPKISYYPINISWDPEEDTRFYVNLFAIDEHLLLISKLVLDENAMPAEIAYLINLKEKGKTTQLTNKPFYNIDYERDEKNNLIYFFCKTARLMNDLYVYEFNIATGEIKEIDISPTEEEQREGYEIPLVERRELVSINESFDKKYKLVLKNLIEAPLCFSWYENFFIEDSEGHEKEITKLANPNDILINGQEVGDYFTFLTWSDNSNEFLLNKGNNYYIYNVENDQLDIVYQANDESCQFLMWVKRDPFYSE